MLAAEISEAKPQPEVRQQLRSVAVPALEPEPGTGKESEADAVPGSDAALRELGELEDMLTESESDLTSSSDDEVEFETEPEPERMRIDGPTMPEQSQQLPVGPRLEQEAEQELETEPELEQVSGSGSVSGAVIDNTISLRWLIRFTQKFEPRLI